MHYLGGPRHVLCDRLAIRWSSQRLTNSSLPIPSAAADFPDRLRIDRNSLIGFQLLRSLSCSTTASLTVDRGLLARLPCHSSPLTPDARHHHGSRRCRLPPLGGTLPQVRRDHGGSRQAPADPAVLLALLRLVPAADQRHQGRDRALRGHQEAVWPCAQADARRQECRALQGRRAGRRQQGHGPRPPLYRRGPPAGLRRLPDLRRRHAARHARRPQVGGCQAGPEGGLPLLGHRSAVQRRGPDLHPVPPEGARGQGRQEGGRGRGGGQENCP